jgi:hypothetical protein
MRKTDFLAKDRILQYKKIESGERGLGGKRGLWLPLPGYFIIEMAGIPILKKK